MDNANADFEKFYRITTQQVQQHQIQQQQQQQYHQHQQIREQNHEQRHEQQQQHPLNQNQHHHHQQQHQQHQQQHHNQQQQHLHSDQIPHRSYTHANFDEQAVLNLVSNDYYSPNQFDTNSVIDSASSNILLDPVYKPNDSQPLFIDQINEENPQQRRNSDIMFSNSDTSNNSYIFTRPPPPPPPSLQPQLISDPHVLLSSSFEPSQPPPPLTSTAGHSRFKPKPRQEQDVFGELISLATKNNANRHDMGSWQTHVNTTSVQYAPSFFTNAQEFDIQPQQSQHSNLEYYQSSSKDSASLAKAAASKALAGPSNATKKVLVTENSRSMITPHSNERIYELTIAQQPSRARMCGFGDKDRRPISPPPVVQLIITTNNGQIVNPETFDVSFLVVMCDSWQQNELENDDGNLSNHANHLSQVISFPTTTLDEEGVETNSAIKMRNLVGSSVSSATKLYDLNGNLGIYFVFQDVSLRTEGCFRLKFSLVDVGSPYSRSVNTSSNSHVLKAIYTNPFTVFTAKKFPGVVQSTPLSKCFARQGIKIPIRKEKLNPSKSKKKQANQEAEFSEEDCENE